MTQRDITSLSEKEKEQIRQSKQMRMSMAQQSLPAFMHLYFSEYIRWPTASFHRQIYTDLENPDITHMVLMAFRGSGKSTIATLGYPIWAVLGDPGKKYVLIAGNIQSQAQQNLRNIKREFASNEILRKDFGPLDESADEWGAMSLVLPAFDARISAVSVEQSIRGTRHGPYRPDLIIADDVEDTNSVKTREGRDKVFDWYTGEIIPAGEGNNTKRIVIGTLLHEDSLLKRLKHGFENGDMEGVYRTYPILIDNEPAWPGKHPDLEAVHQEKRRVGNRIAWHREYLLEILPDTDQVVHREWTQYYDDLAGEIKESDTRRYQRTLLGVDLAISKRDTADYTAMVAVHMFGSGDSLEVYVDRAIVNEHMSHMETLDTIKDTVSTVGGKHTVEVIVEDVGYQSSTIEQLKERNINASGFKPQGSDKRARFTLVSHLFEAGKVYLPRSTSQNLTDQLVGFGVEKHDDLVDALVMCLTKVLEYDSHSGGDGYIVGLGSSILDGLGDEVRRNNGSDGPITKGLWNKKF